MKREIKRLVGVLITTAICAIMAAQAPGGVTAGLQVWLKADAGMSTNTNGAAVSSWQDQSGNGRHATMAIVSKQPTYTTNIINGYPALYTNGGSRFLELDLSSIASGEYTILAVTKRNGTGLFNYFLGIYPGYASNSNLAIGYRQTNQTNFSSPTGSTRVTVPSYLGGLEPATLMFASYSSAAVRPLSHVTDGALYTKTASGGAPVTMTGIGQIGRGNNTSGFTGYISEVIIYNRVLSATEMKQIQSYLSVKYGLASNSADMLYYNEAGYNNDVFGIGMNLAVEGLNVTASNSVSADDIMEVRTPSAMSDGDYLLFGNDNGAVSFAAHMGSNCLYSTKLSRRWKSNRVNDVGTVALRFDLSAVTGFDSNKLAVVIDTEGDGIDNNTAITGTYTAPYFEVSNVDIPDGVIVNLIEQNSTWYAITSGSSTDAIWSTNIAGPAQALTSFCSASELVIRPGVTLTNNWSSLTCKSLTIDGTGILNAGTGTIQISENMTVNGTMNAQTSTIEFNGTTAQHLNGTNLANIYNMTLNNSSGLTISSGLTGVYLRGYLQVLAGNLATGNKLTVYSDVSGTGMVGPLTSGTISGDVTVLRYRNATSSSWINLCSPVQNKTLEDWNDDLTTTGFNGADVPPPYSFNNVQTYNEAVAGGINSGYVGATDITNPIANNTGYFLYQPSGAMTIDLTGSLYTGNQTMPVTFTNTGNPSADGWNLVANPYACTIDWNDSDWTKTNMNNAVYVWNGSTGLYASYVNGVSSNGGSPYIASSQSFFVVANAASPVLTATEGVKSNTAVTFRSEEQAPAVLSLHLEGAGFRDEVVMNYNAEASQNFDGAFDAFKLRSPLETAPYFAAISADGADLSVYSMRQPESELIIPLRLEVGETGMYLFSTTGIEEFAGGACVVLEDLLNKTIHPLRKDEVIELNLLAGTQQLRFQLRIGASAITQITGAGCPGQNEGQVEFVARNKEQVSIQWQAEDDKVVAKTELTQGAERLAGLAAGIYTAVIQNNGVCGTTRAKFEIQQNEDIQALADIKPVSCANNKDGQIEVEILGGSGIYEITWSNGAKGTQVSQIGSGEYTVFVSDANGCDKTFEFTVPILNPLSADFEMISGEFELINGAVEVGFYNTSFGAQSYQWNFGDITIANTEENATHLFNQKGIFDVTLVAKNQDCEARTTKQVRIVTAKNQGSDLAASVIGRLGDNGVELRFFFVNPHKLRISAYNVLGQQIIEPIVGIYHNETITFSERKYASNAIVEVLDLETGERSIIRLGQ
jgi:SprB repeat/PKD domain